MRRFSGPVFREGIQIYLTEGQGFMVYFFCLVILAMLQFLVLILPTGDPKSWIGPAHLFQFSSVAALLLIVYFSLRLANQEFVPWRFQPLKRWLHQEGLGVSSVAWSQVSLLSLHGLIFVLLCSPLLGWAGAIARAPLASILSTLSLLFFYSLTYGIWGLVSLAFWEHKVDGRRVFVRWLFVCLVLLSGLVYLPLNPVAFVLYHLGGVDLGGPLVFWGGRWTAPAVHLLFHVLMSGLGLVIYWRTLYRLKRGAL